MKLHRSDVAERLEKIRQIAMDGLGDAEIAHSEQDDMFREVLIAIAGGELGLRECRAVAEEALKVDDINFERWMA